MTPREIIAEAWSLTCREKLLRRWGFYSSLFETLFLAKLLIYQAWFAYSYLQGNPIGFFDDVIWLNEHVSTQTFITIIAVFIVLLGIEWIFPSLAKGAIIGLTAKAAKNEEKKGGLVLALYNFFPMFGFHELFVLGSVANIVTLCSLMLRYIDGNVKYYIIAFLVLFWVLSMILKFLSSFAEPAVVVNRMSVFAGIGNSFRLILSYSGHVMFLWLLLTVISLRIAINAVVALLIPAIVIGMGIGLATFLSTFAAVMIALGTGIVLLFVASYFFAYLHVFREAVWTITYLELKKHKDLFVIEE
jgi:hypothetical protein